MRQRWRGPACRSPEQRRGVARERRKGNEREGRRENERERCGRWLVSGLRVDFPKPEGLKCKSAATYRARPIPN